MKVLNSVLRTLVFGLLSVLVWLGASPVKVYAENSSVWDGRTATQPTSMKIIDDIYFYEISTAEELAYIAKTGGEWQEYNYVLTKDIVLNETALVYDENGKLAVSKSSLNRWTPISEFRGIFDGNGCSISGLYVDTTSPAGLFGTLYGTVKDLTIENGYVKGENYVGGICGKSDIGGQGILNCVYQGAVAGVDCVAGITGYTDGYSGSYIKNCTNNGDVFSTGVGAGGILGDAGTYTAAVSQCVNNGRITSNGSNVGGICGSYFWTVTECTNNGSVTGVENVGGICGYKHVPVDNCTNQGSVTGKVNVGGIVGYSTSDSSGSKLYNLGTIEGESYVGGICGYGTGRDSDDYFTITEAYNVGAVMGDSYVGGLIGYAFNTNVSQSYNIGNVVGVTATGALIGHSESVWGKGKVSECYYLKTDTVNSQITGFGNGGDFEGIVRDKKPSFFPILEDPSKDPGFEHLGYQKGETDEPISNGSQGTMNPQDSAVLEETVWDGTILKPSGLMAIDGVYYYQIFTGKELAYIAKTGGEWQEYNYILMKDIVLNEAALTYDENGKLVVDASSLNKWTPISEFRGIFDGNGCSISGLYVDTTSPAGLFGTLYGTVKDLTIEKSYVKGENYVGGICGKSDIGGQGILNCVYQGAVAGVDCVAGITGYTDGYSGSYIKNCTNNGDVFSTGVGAGGILGDAGTYTAAVSQCVNNGRITSTGSNVGGICGSYFWTVTECTNNGSVTGVENVGGICGYKHVPVNSCTNQGSVTGKVNVGGIVGYSTSDSSGSKLYNLGTIEGESYVGGICGYGTGRDSDDYFTVTEAYNVGAVMGDSYVGGLIGYAFNTNVSNSFNTGNVVGNTDTGALIGYSESVWGKGKVSECYYLKTDTVNAALWAFGNTQEDVDGVASGKEASFFCFGEDQMLNFGGHTYSATNPCDRSCDNCGYERSVVHMFVNLKGDAKKHWKECDCGEVESGSEEAHRGGTATCIAKAMCEVCNLEYGELSEHKYEKDGNRCIRCGDEKVAVFNPDEDKLNSEKKSDEKEFEDKESEDNKFWNKEFWEIKSDKDSDEKDSDKEDFRQEDSLADRMSDGAVAGVVVGVVGVAVIAGSVWFLRLRRKKK